MISIVFVILGVVWQNIFPTSPWGWGGIVVGLVVGIFTRQMRPTRTPLDGPAVLLAAMGGVSLWATAFPQTTWGQVVRLWSGLISCYALMWWGNTRTRLVWASAGLIGIGVALACLSFFVVRWSQTKLFLIPEKLYTLFPLLVSDAVHPNIMASAMVLLLPLPLALLASPLLGSGHSVHWTLLKRVVLASICLLMGGVLLLTKSRGGYLAIAAGICVALWLSRRRTMALAVLLICVLVGVWLIKIGSRTDVTVELVEQSTDPATLAFRLNVWRVALWMIADFPFTGVGMGTFNDVGTLLYPFYETQNPGAHNLYLQVAVDLGIPGLIAYASMLGLSVWLALWTVRRFTQMEEPVLHAIAAGAFSGLIAFLIHGVVDNTIWNTRAAFLPWLVIGMLTKLYGCVQNREFCCRGSA